jgi:hypothetical protein
MDLESRIKELQRKLAIQKAYLGLQIIINEEIEGELSKEDVDLIRTKVREFCVAQSEGIEQSEAPKAVTESQFTDQEVTTLKMVVAAALQKSAVNTTPSELKTLVVGDKNKAVLQEAPAKVFDNTKPLMAILLSTESVPTDRRKLINSNELVTVVKYNDKEAVIKSRSDYTFVVPVDDLELQQQ